MYDHRSTTTDYTAARAISTAFLAAVQADLMRYRQLTGIEQVGDRPLTFGERLELADLGLQLAHAADQAAAAWETNPAGGPLARTWRQEAQRYRARASIDRAVAVIAPVSAGDDPLVGG